MGVQTLGTATSAFRYRNLRPAVYPDGMDQRRWLTIPPASELLIGLNCAACTGIAVGAAINGIEWLAALFACFAVGSLTCLAVWQWRRLRR